MKGLHKERCVNHRPCPSWNKYQSKALDYLHIKQETSAKFIFLGFDTFFKVKYFSSQVQTDYDFWNKVYSVTEVTVR